MKSFFKITLFLFLVGLVTTPLFIHAATKTKAIAPQIPPQVILTWSVANFYPSNYRGRALPTTDDQITVSAIMLTNGKLTDISNANIVWYKSGEKFDSGDGLTQITFSPDNADSAGVFIRAEITIGDTMTEQTILIPVTQPQIAIEIPYPNTLVDVNANVILRAVPYFFNVSSLNRLIFYWQVGDVKKNMGSENSISIKISAPYSDTQRTVGVSSYVQSKDDLTNIIKTDATIVIR